MKVLILVFAFLAVAFGQGQSFRADIFIRNDPAVVGTLVGEINYNFNLGRMRIDYDPPIGVQEFFEFDALTSVRYLVCPGTCQAETIKTQILRLFREGADTQVGGAVTINGRSCTRFNKANVPAGGINQIFVDGNNFPCRAVFPDGKTFDFENPTAVNGASFGQRPGNCPQPVCTKKQDIVLVFDESGSIDANSFQLLRNFGVDFGNRFNFGSQTTAMAIVQFSDNSRTSRTLTQDKATFINAASSLSQAGGFTCIGCGMQRGRNELFSSRGRSTATKVMVVLTDGVNNREPSGSSLTNEINIAKATPGLVVASIAVAQADVNQVRNIATNNPVTGQPLFFSSPDFNGLTNIVNQLTTDTCTDLAGNACGAGCKGFCACNQQCLCPQLCESPNQCLAPICVNNQNGAGCQFPPKVCNDGNFCTDDSCNPATGCVFNTRNCDDNNVCTTDGCNPAIGCTHLDVDCTQPDPCFAYSCDPQNGCEQTPIFCDRCALGNVVCPPIPCQINRCDPPTGTCVAIPKVCNSNSACIIDSCANDICIQTPVNCDDGNACTVDSCDAVQGCIHTPIDPAVVCDDSSVCTENLCDPAVGCVNPEIPCPSTGSACFVATCNSVLGCEEAPVDCGAVLRGIDPNRQGDCYLAECDDVTGCFLSQIPGTFVDQCGFCAAPGTQSAFCFLGLNVNQAAGLGGGIIAAIVVGVVVAVIIALVSGKKGYDIWRKNRQNMQGAQSNPMYKDPGRAGINPFFEQRA